MHGKPKVIVLNDFAHVSGGASQVALSSAGALARRGHEVTVFAAVGPVMPELASQPNLRVVCTHQHEILKDPNRVRAARQGIWNREAARAFSRVLASHDPGDTVVHVHGWTKALSSSTVREAVRRRFPTVMTLHDYFAGCPNGGFFIYPEDRICHLTGMSSRCVRTNCDPRSYPQKLWRVGRQAVQSGLGLVPNGVKHFVVLSDLSYGVLKGYLPDDAEVHSVGNPIDVAKGDPVEVHRNSAFVSVGRLTRDKGPQLLAEASRRTGVETVFVGDGQLRDEISATDPKATLTGWASRREVLGHLARSRALVFPSLWYEVQPLAPLEAAALGVPVIVSDSCAARDSVEDGVTGLLFEGGSVDDLIRKIEVIRDPETARRMGLAAYERYWATPPTMERHVEGLEGVYARVLRSSRRRARGGAI